MTRLHVKMNNFSVTLDAKEIEKIIPWNQKNHMFTMKYLLIY